MDCLLWSLSKAEFGTTIPKPLQWLSPMFQAEASPLLQEAASLGLSHMHTRETFQSQGPGCEGSVKSLCANSNHVRDKIGEPHKGLSQRQPQEMCADLIAGKKEGFLRNIIQWMDRVHPELSFQEFASTWTPRTHSSVLALMPGRQEDAI